MKSTTLTYISGICAAEALKYKVPSIEFVVYIALAIGFYWRGLFYYEKELKSKKDD